MFDNLCCTCCALFTHKVACTGCPGTPQRMGQETLKAVAACTVPSHSGTPGNLTDMHTYRWLIFFSTEGTSPVLRPVFLFLFPPKSWSLTVQLNITASGRSSSAHSLTPQNFRRGWERLLHRTPLCSRRADFLWDGNLPQF